MKAPGVNFFSVSRRHTPAPVIRTANPGSFNRWTLCLLAIFLTVSSAQITPSRIPPPFQPPPPTTVAPFPGVTTTDLSSPASPHPHSTLGPSLGTSPIPSSSAASPPHPTTVGPPPGVYYFITITVNEAEPKNGSQINDWLKRVFQSNLQRCVLPGPLSTTATGPTSPPSSSNTQEGNNTSLFLGVEVSCPFKTLTNTTCTATLRLNQPVSPCCILCVATKNSSGISVVGNKAERISPLQPVCSTLPEEQTSCIYTGSNQTQCEEVGPAYVVPQNNATICGTQEPQNNTANITCDCSAYCNGSNAFYTFLLSVEDPNNSSQVYTLISKLNETCFTNETCLPFVNGSQYKGANVNCEVSANRSQSCRVLLGFSAKVPTCSLHSAVKTILQFVKEIQYNGTVRRAAICGNFKMEDDLSNAQFTWANISPKPANFCAGMHEYNTSTCQNQTNVIEPLDEWCSDSGSGGSSSSSSSGATATKQPTTSTKGVTTTTTTAAATQNTTTKATTSSSSNSSATTSATVSDESLAAALLKRTENVSNLTSSEIDQLVSELEKLLSGSNVSLALGNISVFIVNNLLGASPEKLSNSSNRIIRIVDTVGFKLVLGANSESLLAPSIALSVAPANGANFQESNFSITDPNNVQVREQSRMQVRSSGFQGSARLPPFLTQNLPNEEQKQASRVHYNFYQKSTLFQDKSLGQRKLNSGVLGATVGNLSISGLNQNVTIFLRHTEPVPANFVATCVFWDFSLNSGSGGWNSDGCVVQTTTENETTCSCNHLTSFAILLDLSRENSISAVQNTILTFITYIGCGVSAIFLAFTLLTYLLFEKLRKDIPSKILIHLCFALLLLNLVFLVDAWLALYTDAVGLCISTAWFLHYFLLASFTWMGLEGVHMYMALVKVFNSHIAHYMLKFSAVGWGVPMVVVIIVIAVDINNYGLVSYGKYTDGTTDEFCWLKNDIAFYVAVVAYFCVIFLFNCSMLIVVLVQLQRIKRQNPQNNQHRSTMQDLRSVTGITFLLGLTWGFAFFAWGPVNLAFMYLFAIFNSLQGFFIFVFHCAMKESVRKQWSAHLCCGQLRHSENSEWSHSATKKKARNFSTSKLTSFHSSHLSRVKSSPSSSFLVSNTSDQTNGIGSPFDDNVITADEDPSMDVVLNEINSQYRHQDS
ncbi:adhesion G-protein coupled receptor G2 isoform X2 [Oryzias melastigma]|uniref:adhesion G-protein coupled receptor G2 isoform X2 n=1 Tax=Oryzias melastigma TaxID=30732 RepID=UPI000CF7F6E9|nr:adhesion G-protein coupled receptor G2 isoform X2 [Oryzias melastigma]